MRDIGRIQERSELRLERVHLIWLTLGGMVALALVFALGVLVGKRAARLEAPAAPRDIAQIDADGARHEELRFYSKLTSPSAVTGGPRHAQSPGAAAQVSEPGGRAPVVAPSGSAAVSAAAAPVPAPVAGTAPGASADASAGAGAATDGGGPEPATPKAGQPLPSAGEDVSLHAAGALASATTGSPTEGRATEAADAGSQSTRRSLASPLAGDVAEASPPAADGTRHGRPVAKPARAAGAVAGAAPADSELASELARGPARRGEYTVQVSSFQTADEAKAYAAALERKGYRPFVVAAQLPGKGSWYRVRLGSFKSAERAKTAKVLLARSDIPAWVLKTQ